MREKDGKRAPGRGPHPSLRLEDEHADVAADDVVASGHDAAHLAASAADAGVEVHDQGLGHDAVISLSWAAFLLSPLAMSARMAASSFSSVAVALRLLSRASRAVCAS